MEMYTKLADRLWARPNFGRVVTLVAFSGFAVADLAEQHSAEFLARLTAHIEDDVDKRVHTLLAQSGRTLVSSATVPVS